MNYPATKYTANQDIRDYMKANGVTQKMLAESMNINASKINKILKTELPQKSKEDLLRRIDAIVTDRNDPDENVVGGDEETAEPKQEEIAEVSTKFQIGDRVKIPSKSITVGTISDIWSSRIKQSVIYTVDTEDGKRGLYAENQLELAPSPITYNFEVHIDNNVAVVTMIATQGENTWVYARGHAHCLHDGEVGLAQAVSYASKRMFESLDTKQENRIYFKNGGNE